MMTRIGLVSDTNRSVARTWAAKSPMCLSGCTLSRAWTNKHRLETHVLALATADANTSAKWRYSTFLYIRAISSIVSVRRKNPCRSSILQFGHITG